MKLVLLTTTMAKRWAPRSRSAKCPLCQRTCRAGQHVLTHKLPSNGFVDTHINIHVRCIEAAIEGCPADDIAPTSPDAQIAAIRRDARARKAAATHAPARPPHDRSPDHRRRLRFRRRPSGSPSAVELLDSSNDPRSDQ